MDDALKPFPSEHYEYSYAGVFGDTDEFNKCFGQHHMHSEKPGLGSELFKLLNLRRRLIKEEYEETEEAFQLLEHIIVNIAVAKLNNGNGEIPQIDIDQLLSNLAEVVDGIIDSIYVLAGTLAAFGISGDVIWREVHENNMSKLGPDGKVIKDEHGKVLKPPTYQKLNMRKVLHDHLYTHTILAEIIRKANI